MHVSVLYYSSSVYIHNQIHVSNRQEKVLCKHMCIYLDAYEKTMTMFFNRASNTDNTKLSNTNLTVAYISIFRMIKSIDIECLQAK